MRKMKIISDDSFNNIVFLGLPALNFEERVSAMKAFMSSHFPAITLCDCSIYYAMNKTNQKCEETQTGYVQVAWRAVRDNIFKEI